MDDHERQLRRLRGLRTSSAALCVGLLTEYGLGAGVSLYLQVPAGDQHHGFATALGRALTSQPAALAVHAGLGLALLIGGFSVLARVVAARHNTAIAASAAGLLAIIAAATTGTSFVDRGQASASMAMAVLTGVALLAYLVNLVAVVPPSTVIETQER